MTDNYVTQHELNEKVRVFGEQIRGDQDRLDERIRLAKVSGFSHYAGRAVNGLVSLASAAAAVGAVVGALTYVGMTVAYGPYDTGKVIYAELSGDKSLKHRHVEEAKALYGRKLHKSELDARDVKNLFLELGVVETEGTKPSKEDVSWYVLLDWIEAND